MQARTGSPAHLSLTGRLLMRTYMGLELHFGVLDIDNRGNNRRGTPSRAIDDLLQART